MKIVNPEYKCSCPIPEDRATMQTLAQRAIKNLVAQKE
jgi:hypothetical protein